MVFVNICGKLGIVLPIYETFTNIQMMIYHTLPNRVDEGLHVEAW